MEVLWSLIQYWASDPVFDHPSVKKKINPYVDLEFPVFQLASVASHPSIVHLGEESGVWLHLLCNLHYVPLSTCRQQEDFLLTLSFPDGTNPVPPFPCMLFSSHLNVLVFLCWTHTQMAMFFFYWWAQNCTQYSRCNFTNGGDSSPPLSLLATLSLIQPRMLLAFSAARAHCWSLLMFFFFITEEIT